MVLNNKNPAREKCFQDKHVYGYEPALSVNEHTMLYHRQVIYSMVGNLVWSIDLAAM